MSFHVKSFSTETQAQIQNPVITTEGTDVQLTIIIPDNNLASSSGFISIKQDSGLSQNQTYVLYLLKNGPLVTDAFSSRLVATYTNTSRTLRMQLKNVAAADAGTFRCYSGTSVTAIADCEQLLVIIRKLSALFLSTFLFAFISRFCPVIKVILNSFTPKFIPILC